MENTNTKSLTTTPSATTSNQTQQLVVLPQTFKEILFPFQQEAVQKIIQHLHTTQTHSAYSACDTGTGKTLISIAAASLLHTSFNVVLCPAIMRLTWKREIERWVYALTKQIPNVEVITSTSEEEFNSAMLGNSGWKILTYDTAAIHKDKFANLSIDMLISDENHLTKAGNKSKRGKAFFKSIFPRAKYKILQSATPFTRNVTDCYPAFHAILPSESTFQGFVDFAANYSYQRVTHWGVDYFGLKNAEQLSKIIRSNFYTRYKKEDVVKDLPPITYSTITLPKEYSVTSSKKDDALLHALLLAQDAVAKGQPVPKAANESIASARRLQGEKKAKPSAEYIETLLEQEIPVVVFAHHKSVIAELEKHLKAYEPMIITGETNAKNRQDYIDGFQNGNGNLIILNIVAGGVGITLTRSSNVVMVEQSFVPSDNYQAISRCHRIGSKEAVTVHWMAVEDSIDDKIMNIVMQRTREFKKVCD